MTQRFTMFFTVVIRFMVALFSGVAKSSPVILHGFTHLVSSSVIVIKYSAKSNLREEVFVVAHSSKYSPSWGIWAA